MALHPLAGLPAPANVLVDVARLEKAYFEFRPDPEEVGQSVSFGTSGHRGSALEGTFTEAHVLAIAQAVCDYRRCRGITGPLYVGKDTHALSGLAQVSALEVLVGNEVDAVIQVSEGVTPTPVISRAILVHNLGREVRLADGIVITPSHNPPEDGGIKYNPPNGGPADAQVTTWIQDRANELLRDGNRTVRRVPYAAAVRAPCLHEDDFVPAYLGDLATVVDIDAIRGAHLALGVDPLGGASVPYWERIGTECGLEIEVVNPQIDPTFGFMTLDHDGRIRMDCSSPYAMANLVQLKDRYSVAFGNDPDADRHGIVTPSAGLMNPNHFLAVAIRYLLSHRPDWPQGAAIGKTLVSSSLIDRVVAHLGRRLAEMPVGFKWFAPGLFDGSLCFGGEESAGASFLRRDGSAWTTDKDGIVLALLAAEITACTGREPGEHYREIAAQFGTPHYARIDAPASPEEKARLLRLSREAVRPNRLAGDLIVTKLTHARANREPIGGLKVVTRNGWFAAHPSGTENICKIYAESFTSQDHLGAILAEAQEIVSDTLSAERARV
jgi:phosphoglucomutase